MTTHLAAISLAKGKPLHISTRPTPKPGPGELLIHVKAVALNPADCIMRAQGLLVQSYPTVLGFDVTGLVLEAGHGVPAGIRPGITRVAAYSAAAWRASNPDYGAFQEKCLVPWQHTIILPDGISWTQAATLPVAVQVPLSAWDAMGIPRLGEATPSAPSFPERKEALLIWGASSSVGTMGVQTARLLRDDPKSSIAAVYATAGSANHQYVSTLGADRVFDYKSSKVVEDIIAMARNDGLVLRHCFLAMGQLAACQAVLRAFVGGQAGPLQPAKIASAPPIPQDSGDINGVETLFVVPSSEEEERLAQFEYWMGSWVTDRLANGAIRPSPGPRVVGKGVEAIDIGLGILSQGVSCTKLVVEM